MRYDHSLGEVAEWSNAPDSKSGIPVSGIVGSNPTLSAIKKPRKGFFYAWEEQANSLACVWEAKGDGDATHGEEPPRRGRGT
jgi:hypothetical protein